MGEFFDPMKEVESHGSKLPHWQQGNVMQFVTFRLGDAMPAAKLRRWTAERTAWLRDHPQPWERIEERQYHERFTARFEHWLDAGHGSCILRDPTYRAELAACLLRDQGVRADHHAWVIMPNHVHLLFTPRAELSRLVKTWKGVSARRIGLGSIWQRNYRDTLIRSPRHFAHVVRYIRRNPVRLPTDDFTHWESERVAAMRRDPDGA